MKAKNAEEKTAEKAVTGAESFGRCEKDGGCDVVRQDAKRQKEGLLSPGSVGFFRKLSNEVVVAFVWAVETKKDKTVYSFNHFSRTTAGKAAYELDVPAGKGKGQIWHDRQELLQEIEIERSGLPKLISGAGG
ncbi:MAG: hypothetical protein JSS82_15570 [Bacteroidetes bacterium]|nr:hypothetical protein [Bacteroidota bacterium]